jgi:lipoprotein-anchoring transpeptidase ErfK/SrfK
MYPRDITVTTRDKFRVKFSQEYVTMTGPGGTAEPARMPYAILIWGQRGVYIHSWPNPPTYAGNGGPTGGCIHLSTIDAPKVFNFVDGRTRIVISYPW